MNLLLIFKNWMILYFKKYKYLGFLEKFEVLVKLDLIFIWKYLIGV